MANKSDIYLLSPVSYEGINHLPMIRFTSIPQVLTFEKYDATLFTSKQAVISAQALNPLWKEKPTFSIGEATSKIIKEFGGNVLHQANGFHGKSLAKDIISYFSDKKILYLRPKKVSFDMHSFLSKEGIDIDEKILYESTCILYNIKEKPPKNSIIIFTSPSTIYCFLKNFDWDVSYRAVLIGNSTKKHLPQDVSCIVAKEASIQSCIVAAKAL